jgi:hypothetical protein
MKYDIKAKPTIYKGYAFRSRLEARWARFFDLMKWRWEYEPYDLTGWSPDFVIKGKPKNILVEVKPFMDIDNDDARETISKIKKYLHKTNNDLAVIVGTGPTFSSEQEYLGDGRLGWFVHPKEGDANIFAFRGHKGVIVPSISYMTTVPTDLVYGTENAGACCIENPNFQNMWARACNRTTFKTY